MERPPSCHSVYASGSRFAVVLRAPTEHRGVELLRGVEVGRHELVPAQGARLVHDPRARVGAGLPDPEHRAGGVGEDAHPADVEHVHRLHEHHAAVVLDELGDPVGAVDVDVGRPHGRARVHERRDAADGPAAEHGDAVAARLGRTLVDVPAEQGGVEGDRPVDVGAADVHPGRDTVLVAVHLHVNPSPCQCVGPGQASGPDGREARSGAGDFEGADSESAESDSGGARGRGAPVAP